MASEPIETVTVTTTIRSLGEPTNSPEPPTLSPVPSLTPTTLATSVRQTSSTADPTALPADTDGQGSPTSGPPMGAIAGIIVLLVIAAIAVVAVLVRKSRRSGRRVVADGLTPNPRRAPGTGSQGPAPWEPRSNAVVEQVASDRPELNGPGYDKPRL
ncbi:hypothetical protein M0657_006094 [Pyricularia oryzae]|uniref:Uncharacterized protein n=2 Tax=Pyricularia oryzae TaxID=318829 RepID=A0AA97P6M7_PYRO3|nr:hypothetical protein OOU_Y34scaffold00180g2 [Pyricularia oryzae Y34]KAI7921383.1 hypothetical protein M0657_006094 [Pyricularia oryzae]